MSAPTPATGDGSPTPGYYPDPSIPGYVRYWNGNSWVPGTSRPAPEDADAAMPVPPGGIVPAATPSRVAEETGPVFLDEETEHESRQEPSSAWQADASRQAGFGGERDRRVSWGGQDPRTPADPPSLIPGQQSGSQPGPEVQPGPAPQIPAPSGPAGQPSPGASWPAAGGSGPAGRSGTPQPGAAGPQGDDRPGTGSHGGAQPPAQQGPASRKAELPAGPEAGRPALPSARRGPGVPSETVALRALRPNDKDKDNDKDGRTSRADGTMSIRAVRPQPRLQPPPQQQPQPPRPGPAPQAAQPRSPQSQPVPPHRAAAPDPVGGPVTPGAGGGAASWPQQVQRLATPGAESEQSGLPPWKPPVEDQFLLAARAQAAARPAGLGKRLVARLIDAVLLGAMAGAIAVPFVAKAANHINGKIDEAKLSGTTVTVWLLDGTTAGCLGVVVGAFLVLGLLYEALPTARWGRTLGKKLCGIQVRGMESYEPPAFGVALTRWLVYGLLSLLGIGVLNVLWCVFDRPWRQCWHDKAARTFVAAD